jgi:peptidyl-prolyl cis-trans isomerase B (cyclophilin B)
MMRFFQIAVLSLILVSCGGSQSEPKEKKEPTNKIDKKAEPKEKEPKEKSYPKLNNENAADFLLEYGKENKETRAVIKTRLGDIQVKLYENTPVHRANFVYLTKRDYYDMTEFYRVAEGFICQAGNSDSWDTQRMRAKIGHYTLMPEYVKSNIHKYGAISAARQYKKNPDERSSGYEFFISTGRVYSKAELKAIEKEEGITFTDKQREAYSTVGGNPYLDGDHTVFGEVISGMDVVDVIDSLEVDRKEWPKDIVPIDVDIVNE